MQRNAGCMECRLAPAHGSPRACMHAHRVHIVRAPPSRRSSNWAIPVGNTSGLKLAPAAPLVPPGEPWAPTSQAAAAISAPCGRLSPGCGNFFRAVRCFSVLLNRQNSVRRGRDPRKKAKIGQALRSGSFEFGFCQKRPGSSRSAKNSIQASPSATISKFNKETPKSPKSQRCRPPPPQQSRSMQLYLQPKPTW